MVTIIISCNLVSFWDRLKFQGWFGAKQYFKRMEGTPGGRRVVKLVELSKKVDDSGAQAFLQEGTKLATLESDEEAVNLVATKNPIVVGGKIFMGAEGIPSDEGNEVMLAGSK
jgi:hypothetical protein